MNKIVLSRELHHEQIEFPDSVPCSETRRGGRGSSLHLQRGKARDVTSEELAWIKEHRPEVFRCLDVLPAPKVPGRTARRLASAQRKKEAAAAAVKASADEAAAEPARSAAKPSGRRSRTKKDTDRG